jgi:hypothetical protein
MAGQATATSAERGQASEDDERRQAIEHEWRRKMRRLCGTGG